MLAQGEIEPLVRKLRGRSWVFGDYGLDGYVQRPRVRPPCEIDGGSPHPHFSLVILISTWVLGQQLKHAVQESGRFSKTTLELIDLRGVSEVRRLARIELQRFFKVAHRLVPAALAAIDKGHPIENRLVVG